jgi:hypothetical protein
MADELRDDFFCGAAAVRFSALMPGMGGRDISGLADNSVRVAKLVPSHVNRMEVHSPQQIGQLDDLETAFGELLPLVLHDGIADEDDLFPLLVRSPSPPVRHAGNGNQVRVAKLPNATCRGQGRSIRSCYPILLSDPGPVSLSLS